MNGAHMFKRSVAVFNTQSTDRGERAKARSVTATFDILRHYCQIDQRIIEKMSGMDDPENGMLLAASCHLAFDAFKWCLIPTETDNHYKIMIYVPSDMGAQTKKTHTTFKDHSPEWPMDNPEDSSSRNLRSGKRTHDKLGVALPNPQLLRLHAALTGVLRLSGAAEIFDRIISSDGSDEPAVPSADGTTFYKSIVVDSSAYGQSAEMVE
ncbi:hypothetical protein BD309DRAFT_995582 [Dichomitus squalens]|uniref:HNH nuclease domain-containing protein n=1 Tax=Dichomitus squalens TaxID=114155 RepID=A0A4Q9PFW2_9APHY|nr:hypothetical protein BD309DRAFT_995582 [Dichomitus squalens]TBU53879.1 hypothetical protein BD310DRAFT_113420 [Dichomitus squalens]